MNQKVTRNAYAKVNLVLDVLSERPDGYHDVRMVMQNLDLYDTLEFELLPGEAASPVEAEITLETNSDRIPTDGKNLIIKAARLMYETYGLKQSMKIKLEKRITV